MYKVLYFTLLILIGFSCDTKNDKKIYDENQSTSSSASVPSEPGEVTGINVGDIAPEISLPDPGGKVVSLSSLRGQYVLIDFWASWCRPCRMENPNVVRMYEKYKGKGFEIFGVSLDQSKGQWVQAIEVDQLSWIHVSDLAYWNSVVVPKYQIAGIPATVLLDKEGRIIAKDLRGEELDKKLGEVLNK